MRWGWPLPRPAPVDMGLFEDLRSVRLSSMTPEISDEENLLLLGPTESVDQLNAEFYGRFPYPWQPAKFEYLEEPDFERTMLNQDIGDFLHRRIPAQASIWVAGCGTNQAIQTALRFPHSQVLGSDLSGEVLDLCGRTAQSLSIQNLELKRESINRVVYQNRFDYIICTGVIHHNTGPEITLLKLATALKPTGILELMVYNRYHRTLATAFQKAVRTLAESRGNVDFGADLAIARALARSVPQNTRMGSWLATLTDRPESDLADMLIQPVEHNYTVESLTALADGSGLELLLPCISPLMKYRGLPSSWNLEFEDPELRRHYNDLPDVRRWQLANVLLHEQSPSLWFYLQRRDSCYKRKCEQQVCDEFLEAAWMPIQTVQRSYIRDQNGTFRLSARRVPYPLSRPEPALKEIVDSVNGRDSMRVVWRRLGWETTRTRVNEARMKLTTSANPYLRSVATDAS